ncbi:hypothetical protein VTH82DRAFT_7258 [Thermothelomyces myriococcoides]
MTVTPDAGDEKCPISCHFNETTIVIRALSVYGQPPCQPVQGPSKPLKPLSHEPGVPHTVSVGLVVIWGGYDEHTVRHWAETGECFARLDWGFPNCNYPKFTTRHLLIDESESSADVSFSGGLAWAEKMLEAFKQLNATNYPDPPQLLPPPRTLPRRHRSDGTPPTPPPPPTRPPFPKWTPPSCRPITRDLHRKTESGRFAYAVPELDDDQLSTSSAATCLTTGSDSSTALSEPYETACPWPAAVAAAGPCSSGPHPFRRQAGIVDGRNGSSDGGSDDHHPGEERVGDGGWDYDN